MWPPEGVERRVLSCGRKHGGHPQGAIHFKQGKERRWWARTGSHKGPIPTSTSSPAPTIHGLCGPIRRIVGASGERMRGVGPCGRPSGILHVSPSLKCIVPRPPPCPLPALSIPANRTIYFIRQHYQNMREHHAQPGATTSTSTHPPNPYPIPQHSGWQQLWLPSSSYSSPPISSST